MRQKLVLGISIALLFTGCGNSITVKEPEPTVIKPNTETVELQCIPNDNSVNADQEKISNELQEQLEKLTIVAESESGKAAIYYDEKAYEERLSFVSDIYLLYDNKISKLPYTWFTKYSNEDIAVECRDFDGDGDDEIALVKSCAGGTCLYLSDIVFIENVGTDKEHHYIYNVDDSVTEDNYDEGYVMLGDFQVDGKALTGINPNVDINNQIEIDIQNDGLYATIKRKSDGVEVGHVTAGEGTVIQEIYWSCICDMEITKDGFIINDTPILFDGSFPEPYDEMCLNMKYKYLGDGKIELKEIYGIQH